MPRFNYRETNDAKDAPTLSGLARLAHDRPPLPYMLPYFVFLLVMIPESFRGDTWISPWIQLHPFFYVLKCTLAGIALWVFWPYYTTIRWNALPLGLLTGLVGTVLWIISEFACQAIGQAKVPNPSSFYNPDLLLHEQWQRWAYLCVRVVGPALVVPPMEELFFRDFVTRTLIRGGNFEEVPVGKFTWLSLLGTSALFGLNHGWDYFVPGFLYGLLMGVLLIRTKSLGACMVAHGVTNWTLYLYVIYTGDWQFM